MSCTLAEYILAILLHLEEINNSTDLLPYHKICLLSGLTLDLSVDITSAFHTFIGNPVTPIVLDLAAEENSIYLQHLVLPTKIPILRNSNYGNLLPVNGHTVWNRLASRIVNAPAGKSRSVVQLAQDQYEDLFFVADPDGIEVYYALVDMFKLYNWKKVAIILADDWSVSRLRPGFSRVYTGIQVK